VDVMSATVSADADIVASTPRLRVIILD